MRSLLSKWTFHKAGQGCFYSGLINMHGKDKFSFVFDCGSTKGAATLREEIKAFKADLIINKKEEIDVLVLSHYDADHVNQLPALLKDLKCEIAVLPYLSSGERLKIYFGQALTDSTNDDDYFSFITSPALYLSDLGVKRIIFIDGNDEENNYDPGEPPVDFIYKENSDEDFRRGISNTSLPVRVFLKPSDNDNDPEKMEFMTHAAGNAELVKGNGSINAGFYWEFFFHERPQPKELILDFREKLRKVFKMELKGNYVSYEELQEMTKNSKARKKMKKNHVDFFGDSNTSGLVVMHGPIGQKHTESFNKKSLYSGRFSFTLLNGDCSLESVHYAPYIQRALPLIRFYQVPHHGSRYSWDDIFALYSLVDAQMIVNYGIANKHKHPHNSVVKAIKSNYPFWELKHNTDKKRYHYYITSYI